MAKIFTLTCNLLAETTLYFKEPSFGKTQRAIKSRFRVGGKGVNVAIFLESLNLEPFNIIFTGSYAGSRSKDFLDSNYKFKTYSIETESPTREGFVLRDAVTSSESTFLGVDSILTR